MKYSMRCLTVLFVMFFLSSCKTGSANKSNKGDMDNEVVISVKYISDYCGGANPSQEVLDALKQEKPLVESDLVLISNGKEISCTTDENGLIKLKNLNEGDYSIYFADKLNSKPIDPKFETVCSKWKEEPNGRFQISEDQDYMDITISKTCNPCGSTNQ